MKCLIGGILVGGRKKAEILQRVPCGQCIACRINKVSEWTARLMHEQSCNNYSYFVTVTYNDEHLPEGGTLVKSDLQKYFKRLRYYGIKFKYYACGEYGEKYGRPHYHILFFSKEQIDEKLFRELWRSDKGAIGIVHVGSVTNSSARYVAGYVNKKLYGKSSSYYEERGILPPFSLMSKKTSIGYEWFLANAKNVIERGYIYVKKNIKGAIPRYYRKLAQRFGIERKRQNHILSREALQREKEYFEKRAKERIIIARKKGWIHGLIDSVKDLSCHTEQMIDDYIEQIYEQRKLVLMRKFALAKLSAIH